MRRATVLLLTAALATAPALADMITTTHFASMAEVEDYVIGGFEFFARGDTKALSVTVTDPPAYAGTPFGLWNDGIPHGFKVVYNTTGGFAAISIDDLYIISAPVQIHDDTNGILVTAFSQVPGASVLVDNLVITTADFQMFGVNDVSAAPPTDYMLIETDLPLPESFILSGTVTFDWEGNLPAPQDLWFEVTSVVVPEPGSLALLALGSLLMLRRPFGT
jgi:hypothetical protein